MAPHLHRHRSRTLGDPASAGRPSGRLAELAKDSDDEDKPERAEEQDLGPSLTETAQRQINAYYPTSELAARHLSDELRSAHPEIHWREIIDTRVILAHAYFHVDQDIIGDVVKRDVPAVRDDLETIVDSLDPG